MTSIVLGDSTLESLTPSVNAPFVTQSGTGTPINHGFKNMYFGLNFDSTHK